VDAPFHPRRIHGNRDDAVRIERNGPLLPWRDAPTIADAFLVPQVFNAEMGKVDLKPYPTIRRICSACNELDAFRRARPENQPDAG
jgi:hypothetical protein